MIDDRFVLKSRLSEGALGTVYRATDKHEPEDSTTRHVALWLLPHELTRSGAALELFVKDFQALRELRHDNIVRVFELGVSGDTYFVTSELLDGETLRNVMDHLRPERLDDEEIDEILVELGDALAYLHERNVVHGDVRPENVLITVDQRFKLLNLAATSFMRAAVSAEPRSDVRDFAALAYELYVGEPVPRDSRPRTVRRFGKQRRKALESALSDDSAHRDLTMRVLLEDAGLAWRPPRGVAVLRPRFRSKRRGHWKIPAVAGIALAAAVVAYTDGHIDPLIDRVADASWPLGRDAAPASEVTPALDASPASDASPALDAPPASDATPALDASPARNAPPVTGRAEGPDASVRAEGTARRPLSETAAEPAESSEIAAARAPSRTGERAEFASEPEPGVEAELDPEPEAEAGPENPEEAPPPSSPAGSGPVEAAVQPAAGNLSRSADGPSVRLSSTAVVARESLGGVSVDVERVGGAGEPLEFAWWTEDGTARAGDDYANFGRRVETFAADEEVLSLFVPLTSDVVPESDEHFFIHVETRAGQGVSRPAATARVTLIDDDR